MYGFERGLNEEEMAEEELEEAEKMIRNGANMRQIMRRRFTYLGQSDIFKLYRKYGMDSSQQDDDIW